MKRFVTVAVALAIVLVSAVRLYQMPKSVPPPSTPHDWKGTASDDAVNDRAALQGRWRLGMTPPGEPDVPPKHLLVINGDTASFEVWPNVAQGVQSRVDKYLFLINSARKPKIIRFTVRQGDGERIPGDRAPGGLWYDLDTDHLVLWDQWAAYGETLHQHYYRLPPAK